jgi:hypothetical protein
MVKHDKFLNKALAFLSLYISKLNNIYLSGCEYKPRIRQRSDQVKTTFENIVVKPNMDIVFNRFFLERTR